MSMPAMVACGPPTMISFRGNAALMAFGQVENLEAVLGGDGHADEVGVVVAISRRISLVFSFSTSAAVTRTGRPLFFQHGGDVEDAQRRHGVVLLSSAGRYSRWAG